MKTVLFAVLGLLAVLGEWSLFAAPRPEFTGAATAPAAPLCLWYRQPAATWEEALPVGNGHLGAMIYGGVPVERIQFNEATIWTGQPHSYAHAGAAQALPEMRRRLFEGRQLEVRGLAKQTEAAQVEAAGKRPEARAKRKEAQELLSAARAQQKAAEDLGLQEFMSVPLRQQAYQPGGDLRIEFSPQNPVAGYRRWLDLDAALAVTEYQCGGATFRREVFASYPDRTLGVRLTADSPGKLDCVVRLSSPHPNSAVHAEDNMIVLRGQVETNGIRFESRAVLAADGGRVYAEPEGLRVTGANSVVIRLVAATSFKSFRDITADPAERCAALVQQSADRSWEQLQRGHLADHRALFRRVSLDLGRTPAADHPTDQRLKEFASGNDPHLAALVFQFGRYLLIGSSRAGGQPANLQGIWVTGGAWLCLHLWDRYLFGGDREFLAKRAYPVMKDAALFFADYLVEDPLTRWLVSGPSNSPEQGGLVMGPTMDQQIIRSLFDACIAAAKILGTDAEFAAKLAELRTRLAPNQVGQHAQLQEWLEDKDNPKNTHRHVSHLWGVHPGWDITWRDRKFFDAARQSLLHRGDAATGWSMGWKVNLWARFLDGDHALVILRNLLRPFGAVQGQGGLYPNLFDACPPFQIDGNFGACAGIAEMLLQSHTGEIHLLPALPKAWPEGSVQGLCARGGVTVDLAWKDGHLTEARLTSKPGGALHLRSREQVTVLAAIPGQTLTIDGQLKETK